MNVLDLFGGCGGLSHGFVKSGCKVVCCNEYEAAIAGTYILNNPDTHVIVDDITKQSTKDQIYSNFSSTTRCDIVCGGPPCVAYSMAGKRDPRDPRGQLFKDYLEVVQHLKPQCFVMENVKGILSIKHDRDNLTPAEKVTSDEYYAIENEKIAIQQKKLRLSRGGGSGTLTPAEVSRLAVLVKLLKGKKKGMDAIRSPVYEQIIEKFSNIGYTVTFKLMNSADYGVPQRRERVIFVGILDKGVAEKYQFPEPTHAENWVSVRTAIDDLKDLPEDNEFSHILTRHSADIRERINKTPIGKSLNPKYSEAFHRCDPDQPSTTVKENHGGVFLHYEKDRVMTPRELARLQSFPDSYKFSGTKSNILKQLGNAVPCGLSAVVAKSVLAAFSAPRS